MAEKRKKGAQDAQAADPTPDGAALAVPDGAAEDLSDDALRLRLDEFEGPFEVLLYLIRSQEIDIFDIPILKVTQQYLHFLDLMRTENLDIAGEFLVMAATLIQIKSRMLLPVETDAEDEDGVEEEDPRLELVEKLLEYRRFRDLAAAVGDLEQTRADCFGRTVRPVFDDEPE
ncbi:MAG TPA: segregation/condensation protein A, partial [Candidatus Hydrogenedentes bacterium]|nr:segregation/condensation protein A [Candidatus Hydrogenedentota bacterium]